MAFAVSYICGLCCVLHFPDSENKSMQWGELQENKSKEEDKDKKKEEKQNETTLEELINFVTLLSHRSK